jgi:hypothetical protein
MGEGDLEMVVKEERVVVARHLNRKFSDLLFFG